MYTLADQWRKEGEERGEARGEAAMRKTILQILHSRFEILDQRFEDEFKLVAAKLETCQLEELDHLVNHALDAFNLNDFLKHLPQGNSESVSP